MSKSNRNATLPLQIGNARIGMLLAAFVLALTALACGLGQGQPDEKERLLDFSEIEGTLTAQAPSDGQASPGDGQEGAPSPELESPTLTQQPTSAPPPTQPQQSGQIGPVHIQFDPGAISDNAEGSVAAGGSATYVLFALGGQVMNVTLDPADGAPVVAVTGYDGQQLVGADAGRAAWTGVLPASMNYTIEVFAGSQSSDYVMTVTILPPDVSDAESGDCLLIANEVTTAYVDPDESSQVFGQLSPGEMVTAAAQTPDGWIGFDLGVAQADNTGLDRLRWVLRQGDSIYLTPACDNALDVVQP